MDSLACFQNPDKGLVVKVTGAVLPVDGGADISAHRIPEEILFIKIVHDHGALGHALVDLPISVKTPSPAETKAALQADARLHIKPAAKKVNTAKVVPDGLGRDNVFQCDVRIVFNVSAHFPQQAPVYIRKRRETSPEEQHIRPFSGENLCIEPQQSLIL